MLQKQIHSSLCICFCTLKTNNNLAPVVEVISCSFLSILRCNLKIKTKRNYSADLANAGSFSSNTRFIVSVALTLCLRQKGGYSRGPTGYHGTGQAPETTGYFLLDVGHMRMSFSPRLLVNGIRGFSMKRSASPS